METKIKVQRSSSARVVCRPIVLHDVEIIFCNDTVLIYLNMYIYSMGLIFMR